MRSFSLKNESGQVLTSAQAHMTDGKNRVLTYASVQPNQAREIVVPRQECLDSLVVQLNNGRTLRAGHLNDCKATQIVVGEPGSASSRTSTPPAITSPAKRERLHYACSARAVISATSASVVTCRQ